MSCSSGFVCPVLEYLCFLFVESAKGERKRERQAKGERRKGRKRKERKKRKGREREYNFVYPFVLFVLPKGGRERRFQSKSNCVCVFVSQIICTPFRECKDATHSAQVFIHSTSKHGRNNCTHTSINVLDLQSLVFACLQLFDLPPQVCVHTVYTFSY